MHGYIEDDVLERETPLGQVDEYIWGGARDNFGIFRRAIRPTLLWNWWLNEVAGQLYYFHQDMIAGRRPKLALMTAPQHGKSWTVTDFMAWVAGKSPDKKIIFGSYSDELGVRTNLDLQRIMASQTYRAIFPHMKVGDIGWRDNTTIIEFPNHAGSFRNTTVNGQINGMELHLGVIDDPIKGRAEANSKVVRDKTWNWFADDFMSRFSKDGALLVIMTRWHVDDMLGRFIERFPDVKVLRYPAIAEHDEFFRKKGDALFPEHKPLEFLLERKKLLTEASWEALYQQSPFVVGGGMIPIEKLKVLPLFKRDEVMYSVRYLDKAGSENEDASFTAGVLLHKMRDGTFVISHVMRGQWSALERETKIETLARADDATWKSYEVVVEQEPGSGGKESAEATIRRLAGLRVSADKVTGAKEVRAEPFAAQVQGGNVSLVAGDWVLQFLDEAEAYPTGKTLDQIDAAAGAFNKVTASTAYLTDYDKWL